MARDQPHDRPKKRAKVAAKVAAAAGRFECRVRDLAIRSIRKQWGEQSSSQPMIDSLLKSLNSDDIKPKAILVNGLLLSVLYALHFCSPGVSDPLPADPSVGNEIADSVNDTL